MASIAEAYYGERCDPWPDPARDSEGVEMRSTTSWLCECGRRHTVTAVEVDAGNARAIQLTRTTATSSAEIARLDGVPGRLNTVTDPSEIRTESEEPK